MAATIVNAVLSDFGLITKDNTNFVNLLGERHKYRDSEEQEFYKFVDGIYINSRKDATLTLLQGENGRQYQGTILKEHEVLVGEPGGLYISHL